MSTLDGGNLCGNGLCVPRPPNDGWPATCGELCDLTTCSAPRQCALAEFSVVGVVRQVPLCVPRLTRCADCLLDAGACGPDAPRCTKLGNEMRCLSACSPDAGGFPQCPAGHNCLSQVGGYRCTPVAGACF